MVSLRGTEIFRRQFFNEKNIKVPAVTLIIINALMRKGQSFPKLPKINPASAGPSILEVVVTERVTPMAPPCSVASILSEIAVLSDGETIEHKPGAFLYAQLTVAFCQVQFTICHRHVE